MEWEASVTIPRGTRRRDRFSQEEPAVPERKKLAVLLLSPNDTENPKKSLVAVKLLDLHNLSAPLLGLDEYLSALLHGLSTAVPPQCLMSWPKADHFSALAQD